MRETHYFLTSYRMAHLTQSQRDQLQALKRAHHSQDEIAVLIGCSQPTVSREIRRNGSLFMSRYTAVVAGRKALARRSQAYISRPRWHDDIALRCHVETELRGGRTPDQIAGRIKQQGRKETVSHQSIYTYVKCDKENGGNLHTFLRYRGKKFKWRGFKKDTNRIPNRKGIEERPEAVNKKGRSGDWESDLVVSSRKGKGAVATFAERTCMLFRAILIADRTADEMVRATEDALGPIPEKLRLTMTHDNGKEIAKHEQITEALNMPVYCARPYRSCDRGLNEFMNRELRRFFPKGTDFSKVTQREIDVAVEWLNNCPRRTLGYRTPNEAFEEKLRIMHFTL